MVKFAIVRGKYDNKGSEEVVKNIFINGEIQKSLEEFSQKYKVVDVQPMDDGMVMIRYED